MASVAKIKVEGADQAEAAISKVQSSLEKFNKSVNKNRDATRLLDKATGGAVTKFQDLQKGVTQGIVGIKGLAMSFKGLKGAIAATGIGLIVVALGTIYAYWDDIVGFISGADKETAKLKEETERTKVVLGNQVDLLKSQLRLAELKGESTDETLLTLRKTLLVQQEITKEQIKGLELDLLKQKQQDAELGFVDYLEIGWSLIGGAKKAVLKTTELLTDSTEEQRNLEDQILALKKEEVSIDQQLAGLDIDAEKRAQKKLDDAQTVIDEQLKKEKEFRDLLNEIEKAEVITKQEKREYELEQENLKYDELIKRAELYGQDISLLEEAQRIKDLETRQIWKEEDDAEAQKIRDKDIADKQAILDELLDQEEKKRKFKLDTLDNLSKVAGEETKLGKALLVAKQLIALQAFLIDIGALKAKAGIVQAEAAVESSVAGVEIGGSIAKAANTLPPPGNLPFILSAVATGAGIISSIMSAVKSTKTATAAAGGSGGGSATVKVPKAPPAFNIVGQSETSQLTEAISGQTQQPTRAYVVSNDVTTAQSLERNIVQGATI